MKDIELPKGDAKIRITMKDIELPKGDGKEGWDGFHDGWDGNE